MQRITMMGNFNKISSNYYYIVIFLSFLNLMYLPLKVGVLSDLLMIGIIVKENLFKSLKIRPFFFFYLFWILLSYIWMGGDRVSCMIMSFGYSILPMLFFIVGNKLSFKDKKEYLQKLIKLIRVMLVISFFLWLFMPDFYCEYLINKIWVEDKNRFVAKIEARQCMQGFFGATATGFFCAVLFLADLKKLLWNKFTKGTVTLFFLDILFLVLNSRKSAMLIAFFLMFVELVNYFRYKHTSSIRPVILLLIVVIMCFVSYCIILYLNFDFTFFLNMLDRFSQAGINKAFSNRSNDNALALSNMKDYMYIVGNGFGSSGHKADKAAGIFIYDNNWMLIFVETGVIGIILFSLAIIENIHKVILNKRFYSFEFYIVFLGTMQSTASNMLENQFVTPLFYLALGCCSQWQLCTNRGEIYE